MNNSKVFAKDTRALVVGGSGGAGASISMQLARLGAHVVLHGASSKAGRLAQKIVADGGSAEAWTQRIDSPRRFVELAESYLPVDILVVAYGPFLFAPLAKLKDDDWERVVAHNLALPGMLISRFVPAMAEKKWGKVLLFGGAHPNPDGYTRIAAYEAAKAGIAVLIRSVAREFGRFGVSALGFYPDFVDTEYVDSTIGARWKTLSRYERLLSASDLETALRWVLTAPAQVVNGLLVPLRAWDAAKGSDGET